MSQYTSQTTVNAPADEVFRFVTDFDRMHDYLPTLQRATPQGEGRIQVEGNAAGHPYNADGWFEADENRRTMRWGSDGEHKYSGHLEVQDRGAGCEVSVTLDFEPNPGMDEEFRKQMGSRDAAVREGLDKALQSIKNICEGTGGKVPSAADERRGYVS